MHIICSMGCMESAETAFIPAKSRLAPTARRFTVLDDGVSGDVFINAMSFLTNHAVDALLDVYDFSRFDTVMDGGRGGLIARIVKRFGCKGCCLKCLM